MNFINKYVSSSASANCIYAEEFLEKPDTVVFSVGEIFQKGLVTKVDINGNLLWEKTYSFDTSNSVAFHKIIQLPASGGAMDVDLDFGAIGIKPGKGALQYVLYATTGAGEHWLMSIDLNGDVIWSSRIYWVDTDVNFFLEPDMNGDGFYLVISTKTFIDSNVFPVVCRFDSTGKMMVCRLVSCQFPEFVVNAARSHRSGISLAGYYHTSFHGSVYHGLLFDITPNLDNLTPVTINLPLVIHDVDIISQNHFLISGYLTSSASLFAAEVNPQGLSTGMYIFPNTSGCVSKIRLGEGGFYFLQDSGQNGIVHKINFHNVAEWSKQLDFATGTGNGVHFLNYNAGTGNLTFTAYNLSVKPVLVHTDANLTSCKTAVLDSPALFGQLFSASACSAELDLYEIVPEKTDIKPADLAAEKIEYCPGTGGGGVEIDESTVVQSPNLYLQSAGSTGADGSVQGIHLRWIFAGALGQKHLPKGNYAGTAYNFNKPNDFVKIYRTAYVKTQAVLDLAAIPYLVDDNNKVWLYRVGQKVFYVYFRNAARYILTRASHNPMSGPLQFIQAYGNQLIEIENKQELFFGAELEMQTTGGVATLQTETLSVAENALAVSRTISSRKTYDPIDPNIPLFCENGRSVRFKPQNCIVRKINFEFYSDFILGAIQRMAWQYIDQYALTVDNSLAFTRLEPSPGLVNSSWQRFNDNAYVNINNYKTKWNGPREAWDRNIQAVVQKYIDLSNAQNNPRALEDVPLQSGGTGGDDVLQLSNLDLLNIAGYDFHIARMLGLGTLDTSGSTHDKCVYIAQYITTGDLEDGGGARTVTHLSMSIPTSMNDQRLPLAVDLKNITPGAFWGSESPDPVNLTDANGYSHDGRLRYVTLFSNELPEDETNKPFYNNSRQFNRAYYTYPVYAGLEYKKNNETEWVKPELPNDPRYLNNVAPGMAVHNETIPLGIPEPQKPLFIHKQRISGTHYYSSYGINWFSRAASSTVTLSVVTQIQPLNPLKPPSNINALLVREEKPLLLTSQDEQNMYIANSNSDRTLIRLSFDYHSFQDLMDYKVPVGANVNDPEVIPADNTEIFADKAEIFFRKQVPGNVSGKAISVTDHASNQILSVIQTGDYVQTSTGDILHPVIAPASVGNYIGGLFIMGSQQYIIHQIVLPTGSMTGPEFTVFKKEISNGIVTDEIPSPNAQDLQSPQIIPDGLFMAVENMQNASSWGASNPLGLKVKIGNNWTVNRELITLVMDDGSTEQHLEKTRGIWDNANVEPVNEPVDLPNGTVGSQHRGLYKFTFQNVVLGHHSQFSGSGVSVDWYQGIIRVHSNAQPNAARKLLKVIKLENIGTADKLVLYAYDASFSTDSNYDTIQTGTRSVNFYPGYKVYLYADPAAGLTAANILPAAGEGIHYSIFGMRSHDENDNYYSRISIPQLMFAQEQTEALPPETPQGSLYATKPDFFGRSTYTFTTKYAHKPHGVLFYRSNDDALLNALYKQETVTAIKNHLKLLGGSNEEFLTNRWKNFLDFPALILTHDYKTYPPNDPQNGYKFPNPDKKALFDWANMILQKLNQPEITELPGVLTAGDPKLVNFVKGAIFNAFVPLTEVPVLYQYINSGNYQPVAKKQVIRDRNGNVLEPGSAEFNMAPMMRITGQAGNETAFTDFTLDGTSNNLYFYGVRELNTQMKMSDFSPFLGPVKLVNSNPPEAPEVKRIMPVLGDQILGIAASVQLEINAYPAIQNVKKATIYRAFNKLDAQSVRSMTVVKVVDLETAGISGNSVWQLQDTFDELTELPFNDGLFYRLTVSREIEYDDKNGNVLIEYAPSLPSKIVATMIVEDSNPPSPVVSFTSDAVNASGELHHVKLHWNKSAYKARYHVYKMNNSGNWTKIHELLSNDANIILPLEDTDLQSDVLQTLDADNNTIYSHFKVVAENTSGMLSVEQNILTIPVV